MNASVAFDIQRSKIVCIIFNGDQARIVTFAPRGHSAESSLYSGVQFFFLRCQKCPKTNMVLARVLLSAFLCSCNSHRHSPCFSVGSIAPLPSRINLERRAIASHRRDTVYIVARLIVKPKGRMSDVNARFGALRSRYVRDQRASAPFRDGRSSRRPIDRLDLVGEIAGWAKVRASEIETRRKCSSDLRRRLFAGFDGYDSSLFVRRDSGESRFLY
jgi:hypothetical protein